MVFFTCNSCGESLKKAQIEKHIGMCRGCSCLSCIDCGKDFWGEDYKSHLRCISEDQKYGGRGYEAKANKGDVKQQQWIQRIQEAMSKPGISPRLKDVLNQVSSYDNVPRKKAKFQNWIKCSMKIYDASLQDQVWEIISAADSNKPNGTQHPEPKPDPPLPQQQQQQNVVEDEKHSEKKKNKRERKEERQKKNKKKKNAENGESITDEQKIKKKKKRKRTAEECEEEEGQDEEEEPTSKPKKRKGEEPGKENQNLENVEDQQEDQEDQDQSGSKGKFNWKGTIKAVLRQGPDEGLSVKKLRKKVLAAYYSFSGDGNFRSEEELFSTFNKKLSGPKFKVLKDKVRLVK